MGLKNWIFIVFVATELFFSSETRSLIQDHRVQQSQIVQQVHFSYSDKRHETQDGSHQTLIVFQQYYKLQFQYPDTNYVPHSLINLLKQYSVKSLLLQMGYINPSSSMFITQNQHLSLPIYHGIALFLLNTTKLSDNNFQSIAQVFSISKSSQFMLYLDEISRIYASNPNDKFCAQHLKVVIDTFMPCKTVSGVGALINEKTFFQEKDFFGLQLQWNVQKEIQLTFYLQKNNRQIRNFIRLTQEKRNLKRCMYFDKINAFQKPQSQSLPSKGQRADSQKFLPADQSFSKSVYWFPLIKSSFKSNYYRPQKVLKIQFNLDALLENQGLEEFAKGNNQIDRDFKSDRGIKQIVSRFLLPKGFQVSKIQSFTNTKFILVIAQNNKISQNYHGQENQDFFLQQYVFGGKICHNINTLLKFRYKFSPDLYLGSNFNHELNFTSNSHRANTSNLYLYVLVHYRAHLKPFEQYQTLAGGGQEFINIPTLLITKNSRRITFNSVSNSNMFDRLLQPDFSIPFHTLTFTTAIFGYLWIAIWKALYRQIDENKSIKKKLLSNKRQAQDQKMPNQQTNTCSDTIIQAQIHLIN